MLPTTYRKVAPTLALAALAVAACAEPPTQGVVGPSLNPTPPPPAERITVCKDVSSPAGTFNFTVSQVGGRGGTLLAGDAFSLTAGQCVDVWEALPNPPIPDTPAVRVTVTELAPPAGVQFDSLVGSSEADGPFLTTGPSWTVRVNYFHGALYTYFNSQTPPPPPPPGGEGCTPGFWKAPQHFDSWAAPYTPGTLFGSVFENAFPGLTLLQVMELNGGAGGLNQLGRAAVAALLNAASPDVDYYLATPAEVINAFNAVFPGGDYGALKSQFDAANNAGCPIS
jgi:hypothetical protein